MQYFGLAFSGSMLIKELQKTSKASVLFSLIEIEDNKQAVEKALVCLNPSHQATVDVLRSRLGLNIKIPNSAPKVSLKKGDTLFVLQVQGLPRLQGRSEYTEAEIESAQFYLIKAEVD